MSITDAPALVESFSLYGSGVTLVAAREGGQDRFFIAASVLTCSVDPFTLAVSIGRERPGASAIAAGEPWSVSILAAHHEALVRALTGRTTREQRLAALAAAEVEASPEGPPWLPDALVTLWCRTQSVTPVHDQLLVVGEVERGGPHRPGDPLLRWNRAFRTAAELSPPPAGGSARAVRTT